MDYLMLNQEPKKVILKYVLYNNHKKNSNILKKVKIVK